MTLISENSIRFGDQRRVQSLIFSRIQRSDLEQIERTTLRVIPPPPQFPSFRLEVALLLPRGLPNHGAWLGPPRAKRNQQGLFVIIGGWKSGRACRKIVKIAKHVFRLATFLIVDDCDNAYLVLQISVPSGPYMRVV